MRTIMEAMVFMAVITIVLGFGIGVLSGLLGVGGGSLMVPMFTLVLGMNATTATGTSLFTIIPTSLSGGFAHLRDKTADLRIGLTMGLGGACGSPAGVWLAQQSPEWLVVCAVALVIVYSAFTMLRKALKQPKAAEEQEQEQEQEGTPFRYTAAIFAKSAGIGLLAGVAGGYVGLGGGFIMVPLMLSLLRFPMKLASGTSLVAIVCIAIPGAIAQASYGSVDFLVGIFTACGSIPGAALGARLAKRINDRTLRFMFVAVLVVAAIMLVVKQFL